MIYAGPLFNSIKNSKLDIGIGRVFLFIINGSANAYLYNYKGFWVCTAYMHSFFHRLIVCSESHIISPLTPCTCSAVRSQKLIMWKLIAILPIYTKKYFHAMFSLIYPSMTWLLKTKLDVIVWFHITSCFILHWFNTV